jgi:hypothetical protein
VLALASDTKADLLEHPDRVEVIDARDTRHPLADLHLTYLDIVEQVIANGEYSRIASRTLERASASVAPWDQQPGRPGTETLYPSLEC